jgi:hypothetical protein
VTTRRHRFRALHLELIVLNWRYCERNYED